jgi:hypothetical protein
MSDRYLYSIYPRKPIKLSDEIGVIRVPKSLQLTKEEVLKCLKFGPVQRRFANENIIEKVYPSNLDRLHNAKYMTEEEYEKFAKKYQTGIANLYSTDSEPEAPAAPEVEPEKEETPAEQTAEAIADEDKPVESEAPTEEKAEPTTSVDTNINLTTYNGNNNYRKNKHHK